MRQYQYPIAAVGIAMAIGCSVMAADGETSPEDGAVGLANPAAVFCIEHGGHYEIRETEAGSTGTCILSDGTEVDAWTYFRAQSEPKAQ